MQNYFIFLELKYGIPSNLIS